jgi:hypothetical protein
MRTALRFRSVALVVGVLATLLIGHVAMPVRGGGFGGNEKEKDGGDAPASVRTVYLFTPMTPKAAQTWLKLQEPITVPFANETPLEDFLKFIKDETRGKDKQEPGISFYVDPVGLNEVERTMTSPITVDLENLPIATVLGLALRQLGLQYSVQKDGLVVITDMNGGEKPEPIDDPTPLVLEGIESLRAEVAALRREVSSLRKGR